MSIGSSPIREDAAAKVTGQARYPADRTPPDAVVAKVVFTDQPHARLVSLDTSAASASPGVLAILTGADVAVNEYGLTLFDQPVFVSVEHTGRSSVRCDVSRWEADHLAVVVAETTEQADAAANFIEAEWEQLDVVADIDDALADDAPLLHAEDGLGSNAYHNYKIRKGDMQAGWARAAAVVEATYELPHQEHAYLQPEAGLAYIDDEGRVVVEVGGQWTHEDREQIAHALDLPEDRVRVIYPPIGGAFGGREDMSLQIVLALAAKTLHESGTDRPVVSQWSREESIVGHHKRHRGRIKARWGADADGKIVAIHNEAWLDAGAYNYTSNKVLGNCHIGQAGPYEVPNAHIDSHAVYTNSVPGGAFRGFGGPQAAFVAESQMNRLAHELGIDPVEIRRRNLLSDGSIGITQTPMPDGVTIREVVEACATEADFDSALGPAEVFSPFASLPPSPASLKRGRGIACALKNVGFSFGFPERCEATIVLHGEPDSGTPDRAELFHAGAEVGQGSHTAFLQMAAEATGIDLDKVEGRFSDTASSGDSGSASASRLTFMAGNSILGAAEEADRAWQEGHRPAVGHFRYVPPSTEPLDPETGICHPNFSYGYVAQVVELTVDTETGHIVIDRVVSTHDVGKAINPDLVVGQIEGAVVQAHGYTLSERLRVDDGRILNPRFSSYLIPGIADVPTEIKSVVLELADPRGPWGARGMAEMPYMTYAPAVIAALHDATGIWFETFPLTPDTVLARLGT
ncbi:MAG: xanthine dehydrogenase family protein [Actinomycetia bacterium]|nr:xanthine dehydrogenase family protein [Actinomycetes bacterium]MCP4961276.1 xanthine dehydrogenase family protein [Actinomycetes bacterium]